MLWFILNYQILPPTFRYPKLFWIDVFISATTPVFLRCLSSGPTYPKSSLLGKMKSLCVRSFPVRRLGDKPFLVEGGMSPTGQQPTGQQPSVPKHQVPKHQEQKQEEEPGSQILSSVDLNGCNSQSPAKAHTLLDLLPFASSPCNGPRVLTASPYVTLPRGGGQTELEHTKTEPLGVGGELQAIAGVSSSSFPCYPLLVR